MNSTRVYLDHAATTPLLGAVKSAMEPFWSKKFGNASSPYAVARESRMALDVARSQVAKLIGAHADEIAWTGGGTEADNWALLGVALANFEQKGHFVVSQIEHHAVWDAAQTLCELGFEVDFARPNARGIVEPEEIARLLRNDTLLVSLMSANNETGVVQPIFEVAQRCNARGVLFHCDATQSAGKTALDVDILGESEEVPTAPQNQEFGTSPSHLSPLFSHLDLLTLSAHKIGGPKGVGALYIRRGTKMKPLLRGGAQERGRRAGTENVPGIVGFGVAAELARTNLDENAAHLQNLRFHLENGLKLLPNVEIIGENAPRAPHICAFLVRGVRAESLALNLDLNGFAVGTGSACASGALEPSHVLAAMGFSPTQAKSALRVSVGLSNTLGEIEEFLAQLKRFLKCEK